MGTATAPLKSSSAFPSTSSQFFLRKPLDCCKTSAIVVTNTWELFWTPSNHLIRPDYIQQMFEVVVCCDNIVCAFANSSTMQITLIAERFRETMNIYDFRQIIYLREMKYLRIFNDVYIQLGDDSYYATALLSIKPSTTITLVMVR